MPIQNFACKDTEELFNTGKSSKFSDIKEIAERKLQILDNFVAEKDIQILFLNDKKGGEKDKLSKIYIVINNEYKLRFSLDSSGPKEVEIVSTAIV